MTIRIGTPIEFDLGFGKYEARYQIDALPDPGSDRPNLPLLSPEMIFIDIDEKEYRIIASSLVRSLSGSGSTHGSKFTYSYRYLAAEVKKANPSDNYLGEF